MTQRNWSRRIALLLFALVSLAGAIYLHPLAFPIANVAFDVSRPDASARMAAFLEDLGHPLSDYQSACAFGESSADKNFVDRQYGAKRVEEAERSGVNLWYWKGRWFKPGQREEFRAWLSPAGRVVGFNHVIEEAAERPVLPAPEARAIAEEFLKTHIVHHPLAKLKFVEESATKRPARTDYSFTWEREDLRLDDASYRLWVKVYGNEVGGYSESLREPEWWRRDFAKERSTHGLLALIAMCTLIPIFFGALALLITKVKKVGHQGWPTPIPLGWLVAFGLTSLLATINSYPDALFSYSTTQDWEAFLFENVLSALEGIIACICIFSSLFMIGELARQQGMPEQLPLKQALGATALRDPRTVRALGMGIIFALFSSAYVSVFYLAGQRWGIWCPVDVDYSKTIGGWLPWAEPLKSGLFAAFGEELIFRIIALVLIWRVVRVRWIAIVLSATIWAFLHSDYPQMPAYARGIELTIEGVIWSFVMLRYGIVSTITAHYLYNCWIGSAVLLQSPLWSHKVGALVVSLWPVALFAWGWMRHRSGTPSKLSDEPQKPATKRQFASIPPVAADFSPRHLALWLKIVIPCAAILAVLLMVMLPQPQERLASLGGLGLSREQIVVKADEFLRLRGQNPEDFRRITTLTSDGPTGIPYLLQYGTHDQLADLSLKNWNDVEWKVRYFQIKEQEEITLYLDKHGNLASRWPEIPREAPGAQLEHDIALQKVHEALAQEYSVDLSQEVLVSERLIQQEKRRDWLFVFERKEFPWGEAKLRTSISLKGDDPVNFRRTIQVPESWNLRKAKNGWRELVAEKLNDLCSIGIFIIAWLCGLYLIYKSLFPWKIAATLALLPLILESVDALNSIPWFYASYSDPTPIHRYWFTELGMDIIGSLIFDFFTAAVKLGLALGLLRLAFKWLPENLVLWPEQRQPRARFWSDTLLIVFGSTTLFALISFTQSTLQGYWFPSSAAVYYYPQINVSLPWLDSLTNALRSGFEILPEWGFKVSCLYLLWLRFPKATWILFLMLPVLDNLDSDSVGEFIFNTSFGMIWYFLYAWFLLRVWRFNAAAIFLTFLSYSLMNSISLYLTKGGPNYQGQAIPLLLICLAAGVAGLFAHYRSRTPQPAQSGVEEATTR